MIELITIYSTEIITCLTILAAASESLPMTKKFKANGVIHLVINIFKTIINKYKKNK